MRRDLALYGAVLLMTAGLSYAALTLIDRPLIGVDDANIFFTYGRNLAQGHGFVYNVGGERVEGFTSLLWVLICAAVYLLVERPEPALLTINILFVWWAMASLARFTVRDVMRGDTGAALRLGAPLLLLGWVFTSPSFVTWTTISLMDTGLYCAAFTLGTICVARAASETQRDTTSRRSPVAVCIAWILVTRPEGMLIACVWIAALGLGTYVATGSLKAAMQRCRRPAVVAAVGIAALFAFRLSYFGYPFPNTYYAKVSPSTAYNLRQGLIYATRFATSQPFVTLGVAASVVWLMVIARAWRSGLHAESSGTSEEERSQQARGFVVAVSVLTGIVIPVLTGGDHFVMFRVYQPIWPLLAVPLLAYMSLRRVANGVPRPDDGSSRIAVGLLQFSLVVGLFLSNFPTWTQLPSETRIKKEFEITQETRAAGHALNLVNGNEAPLSVGVIAAGGVALTYRGPLIDLMGLNNIAMGHSPGKRDGLKNHAAFNQDVFFQLSPDVVFPRVQDRIDPSPLVQMANPRGFHNRILRGLFSNPEFRRIYRPVCIGVPGANPVPANWITAWCKSEIAERLTGRGIRVMVFGDEIFTQNGSGTSMSPSRGAHGRL